jgi:hypothetical protein
MTFCYFFNRDLNSILIQIFNRLSIIFLITMETTFISNLQLHVHYIFNYDINNFLTEIFNCLSITSLITMQTTFWLIHLMAFLLPLQHDVNNFLFDHLMAFLLPLQHDVNNFLTEIFNSLPITSLITMQITFWMIYLMDFYSLFKHVVKPFWLKYLIMYLLPLKQRCK